MLASPLEQDTKVDITDLTHASVEGNGVFDVLMRAVNAHLQKEWSANRLKGTEYSTVYLGALESTMNASLQFLLARDKTNAELDILKQQLVNLKVEEANAIKQGAVLVNQASQIEAQTSLTGKQELQVIAETLNVPKQGQLIDANRFNTEAQTTIANTQSAQDLLNKQAQVVSMGKDDEVKAEQALQIAAQTSLTAKQELQVIAETLNVPKQGDLIDAQKDVQVQQKLNLEAQKLNISKEGTFVDKQRELVEQKKLTEADSLLTAIAQRSVLTAQATGFKRDSEQKAAEIMIRGFSVIATTSEMDAAAANGYGISSTNVAAALTKLNTNAGV